MRVRAGCGQETPVQPRHGEEDKYSFLTSYADQDPHASISDAIAGVRIQQKKSNFDSHISKHNSSCWRHYYNTTYLLEMRLSAAPQNQQAL
jgi:hypothetical protein